MEKDSNNKKKPEFQENLWRIEGWEFGKEAWLKTHGVSEA